MGRYLLGASSSAKLATCHPVLQKIAQAAMLVTPMDFTIVVGWRGKADQDAAVAAGASKTPWPTSKHNHMNGSTPESYAFDFAPWYAIPPNIRWNEGGSFRFLAGLLIGVGTPIAQAAGFRLRYGGDFNGDGDLTNDSFVDNDHLEIVPL